ncbi:MAG: alcohol dehydrogenase catalytic domain-containing protein, partial [Spirochaetota bacterium]
MKAVICTQYGPPEDLQLKEVEKPAPKDNEILIKVHAATVNRTDCGILRGKPFIIRFFTGLFKPYSIPGTEFAGIIEAAGKNVSSFKVGDKVFGFDDSGVGAHAEHMTIGEDKAVTTMPKN